MKQNDDGGPAFPAEGGIDSGLHPNPGMSLRDYFAAAVATGLCANQRHGDFMLGKCNSGDPGAAYQQVATTAYRVADAMLAERAKAEGA